MRYPPQHKAETRQKIVKDASRRVRSEGLKAALQWRDQRYGEVLGALGIKE